jgi:hypothetical protein
MKHSLFAAFGAVAVAGTLTLSAQTPTPPTPRPQTPAPSPSTPSRTDDKTMTLTGCLKAQDASMDAGRATSAPSAATAAAGKFVLTTVDGNSMGTSKPDSTTPGSTTPGASNAGGKQYALTADAGVNLAAHVNHQVRVTGKLSDASDHSGGTMAHDPAAKPDAAKPSSTARPGEATPSADRANMGKAWPTLAVSSVTMISSSCTATL